MAAIGLMIPASFAGTYGPQPFDYPDGTSDLGDGSKLTSNDGEIQVRRGALQPIPLGWNEVAGVFTLPVLDPDRDIDGFTASFDLDWRQSRPSRDHFYFHFGAIPDDAPEIIRRFEIDEGLAIQIEYFGLRTSMLEVFCQGSTLGRFPFPSNQEEAGQWVIRWDSQGLDLSVGSNVVFTDLALLNFMPEPGYRFAFSAANRSQLWII